MLSIKLQQMFVVLQSGGPNTYSLHEAYINIAYDYQCAANSYYGFTDRMICTEPFYGGIGPCNVRGL